MQSIFKPIRSVNLVKSTQKATYRHFSCVADHTQERFLDQQFEDRALIKARFSQMGSGDKSYFKNKTCLIPISVGQNKKMHNGPYFAATLSLINRSFKRSVFVITDTLQVLSRRIYNENVSIIDLLDQSYKDGNDWIKDNLHLISDMTIPREIIQWSTFMEHPKFEAYLEETSDYYKHDAEFKAACDDDVDCYLSRNSDYHIDTMQARRFALEYLWCECAVMRVWAEPEYAYDFEIYPSGRKKGQSEIHQHFIEPKYPDVLKFAGVRFKKYSVDNNIVLEKQRSVYSNECNKIVQGAIKVFSR